MKNKDTDKGHRCSGCLHWNGGEGDPACITCKEFRDVEPMPYEPHIKYFDPAVLEGLHAAPETEMGSVMSLMQGIDLKLATVFFQHHVLGGSVQTLASFWGVDPTTVRRWLKEGKNDLLKTYLSQKEGN